MDGDLIKWASALGVGGVLGAMMFVFYRIDFLRERTFHRDAAKKLTAVVEKNAEASTTMAHEMRELCGTIKADVLARGREMDRAARHRRGEKGGDDA